MNAFNLVGWLRRLKLSGRVALYSFVLLILLTAATTGNALTLATFNFSFSGTGVSATGTLLITILSL
jgi:hypothetical protein